MSKSEVQDFLVVKITRDFQKVTFTLTQPQLIASIIADLGLQSNSNTRQIPELSSKILQAYASSEPHSDSWSYCSIVGK
jgi:polysaccharide deacetylase 2 family uncharacterized protein YibQ